VSIRRGRQIVVSNEASEPIPVAARSKVCVCGRYLAGNPGSNFAGVGCLSYECCVSERDPGTSQRGLRPSKAVEQ
jgi:hypothetical protein